MTALILAVFVASLTGSLHCAGMCGPFVALVHSGSPGSGRRPALRLHVAYNGGRLVTYSALGAVAGFAGSGLDLGGTYLGLQRLALTCAALALIGVGLATLLQLGGVAVPRVPLPTGLQAILRAGHRFAAALPPVRRAAVVGLLSTFLPCGWLYAFVLSAAGTASPWLGALTMAVFWAGTLPILVGLGAGVRTVAGPLRRHLPAVAAVALVVVGLITIAGRYRVPALVGDPQVAASVEHAAGYVHDLGPEDAACCNPAP